MCIIAFVSLFVSNYHLATASVHNSPVAYSVEFRTIEIFSQLVVPQLFNEAIPETFIPDVIVDNGNMSQPMIYSFSNPTFSISFNQSSVGVSCNAVIPFISVQSNWAYDSPSEKQDGFLSVQFNNLSLTIDLVIENSQGKLAPVIYVSPVNINDRDFTVNSISPNPSSKTISDWVEQSINHRMRTALSVATQKVINYYFESYFTRYFSMHVYEVEIPQVCNISYSYQTGDDLLTIIPDTGYIFNFNATFSTSNSSQIAIPEHQYVLPTPPSKDTTNRFFMGIDLSLINELFAMFSRNNAVYDTLTASHPDGLLPTIAFSSSDVYWATRLSLARQYPDNPLQFVVKFDRAASVAPLSHQTKHVIRQQGALRYQLVMPITVEIYVLDSQTQEWKCSDIVRFSIHQTAFATIELSRKTLLYGVYLEPEAAYSVSADDSSSEAFEFFFDTLIQKSYVLSAYTIDCILRPITLPLSFGFSLSDVVINDPSVAPVLAQGQVVSTAAYLTLLS